MTKEDFSVFVEKGWGNADYDEWQVVIRRGGSGNVIQPFFRSREKAERVASALYKILKPEFDREQVEQRRRYEQHEAEVAARPKPKPFVPTKKMSRVDALKCGECEELYEDSDVGEAVYECSRCGQTQVEERRCENCHVFMAKVADDSCPHCEAPIEEKVEHVLAVRAPDGSLHEVPS